MKLIALSQKLINQGSKLNTDALGSKISSKIEVGKAMMKAARKVRVLVMIAAALSLALCSQGCAKTKHSVNLSWSPSQDAEFYRVYRSTTSGGPYQKIGNARLPIYSDKSVESGATYYYVVSAVRDMKESGYSKEMSAVVP